MNADKLMEGSLEVKALVGVYSEYALSHPKSEAGLNSARREMKAIKGQILKTLADMKKHVRKLEADVKPE